MAVIQFAYYIFKDDEQVFKSTADVKLTKKQLKDTEDFIVAHNYSADFVDIPHAVYDKCCNNAYEKALSDYPEYASNYEELSLEMDEFIPVSLIMLLSDEVKRKMLTAAPYYFNESVIFPTVDLSEDVGGQAQNTPSQIADIPSDCSASLDNEKKCSPYR